MMVRETLGVADPMPSSNPNADAPVVDEASAGTAFTVVGTYWPVTLPTDLDQLMPDGVLIDRRNGTPMEMDAYSAYLGLKALALEGRPVRSEMKRIVDALLRRLAESGGLWRHGAWTGSDKEVHLRFTAAAIRLLVEAWEDDLFDDASLLGEVIDRHMAFSEAIDGGTWFLHDSLERAETGLPMRGLHRNRALGSSPTNCLVLNTHVDTLSTLIDARHRVPLSRDVCDRIDDAMAAATAAMDHFMLRRAPLAFHVFGAFDTLVRFGTFFSFKLQTGKEEFFRRQLRKYYYPARTRFKALYPYLVFHDGYLERDISLDGSGFEYHLVNIHDILRYLVLVSKFDLEIRPETKAAYISIVDRALDYAVHSSYRHHLIASMSLSGRSLLFCEALLMRIGLDAGFTIPASWADVFFDIRQRAPATPALRGYDPFVVGKGTSRAGAAEALVLIDGRRLRVDASRRAIEIEAEQ